MIVYLASCFTLTMRLRDHWLLLVKNHNTRVGACVGREHFGSDKTRGP